jgi:hypothetical protein
MARAAADRKLQNCAVIRLDLDFANVASPIPIPTEGRLFVAPMATPHRAQKLIPLPTEYTHVRAPVVRLIPQSLFMFFCSF